MVQQLSNSFVYQIDSDKTDFYSSNVKKIDSNSELRQALLNTSTTKEIASSILGNSQFNAAYRQGLVDTIKRQYSASAIELKSDSIVAKNIESLADSNTLTVTTGQQIHIFLGPFFVVNKILSCCAEALKVKALLPDNQVVPIFWMATEDHDFDEIKSARLYNETYTWDIESEGPVGRLNPESLLPIVKQARERIDQTAENLAFIDVCDHAYSTCSTFADATRYIIHQLFEETGIVVLDPDDAFLKSQFKQVIEDDLLNHQPSQLIDSSIQTMKTFGMKAPINTRPINTFYLTDNKRIRIEKQDDNTYLLVDGSETYSETEILDLLGKHPERFSPNALLRPVYQQQILPNISYITGASEMIYWLELGGVMTSYGINYPELSIRKSAFFVSQKNKQKLDNEGIHLESLFVRPEKFQEIVLSDRVAQISEIERNIVKSDSLLNSIFTAMSDLGSKNTKKLQKSQNQLINSIKNEQGALLESLSNNDPTYNQLLKIKSSTFDNSYIQERNKYIISMVPELMLSRNWFKLHSEYYTNHKIITIISA